MGTNGITINGQHYDSPDAMPPDVRRLYHDALRAMATSLPAGKESDTTQVFTGEGGSGVTTRIVVRKTITVNGRTDRSIEEMPPELRPLVESGLPQARPADASAPSGQPLVMQTSRPALRVQFHGTSDAPPPPIEPSSMDPDLRRFLHRLVYGVVIALILWAFLGRIRIGG